MGAFKDELEHFFKSADDRPKWHGPHVPDELYSHIRSLEDFKEFIAFVNDVMKGRFDYEVLEFGCDETNEFFAQLEERIESDDHKNQIAKWKIDNDWGRLAYAMGMAIGNPMSRHYE